MSNHWSKATSNPNEIGARRERARFLRSVTDERPVDRIERICEISKNKNVLDVGCVSHESSAEAEDYWLHKKVAGAASQCLGIDILEDDIQLLKIKGYNVITHDLTSSPLNRDFDVVVCGELVEHLGNIANFLDHCRASLRVGGQLVITTPFPWFAGSVLRNLFSRKHLPGSLDHVAWYDPSTISELADRHGFTVKEIRGVKPLPSDHGNDVLEAFYKAARNGMIPGLSRLSGCRSLLYRLERTS